MAPKEKKAVAQGLEASFWDPANKLRSNVDAAEYKHVVLGIIFLKYISDIFARRQMEPRNALAQAMKADGDRSVKLGLSSDELAFYDAICANSSAVMEISDETLKKIAHELVEIVRRDAKTECAVKEHVHAKLRATIKRLLLKCGYSPDQEAAATQLVPDQVEVTVGESAE